MSNADRIAFALLAGGAAIVALYAYVYLPQQQAQATLDVELAKEGGEDLQPTNQRIEDPLGKNLGVSGG